MMTIQALRDWIEQKPGQEVCCPMIWVYKDTGRIVCEQYLDILAENWGREKKYISEYHSAENGLFGTDTRYLTIWFTDTVDSSFVGEPYMVVCCHKVDDPSGSKKPITTEIPEVEDWQLVDYAKGVLPGVSEQTVELICKLCTNKFRLMQEIDKVKIFPKELQNSVVESLMRGGNFEDLTEYNIFNLTNAIQKKDIKTLTEIMLKIEDIDVNPIGLSNLLYSGFKDIMAIKTLPNALPQSLGIQPKRYNALKYYVNYFTTAQLSHILRLLVNTDQAIKGGDISVDMLTDYIITHIFA